MAFKVHLCFYCGKRFTKKDFEPHMKKPCRLAPDIANYRSQAQQEQTAMAKKAAKGKRYASGEVPDAGAATGGERGERRPFLRVQDVPGKGATVTFNGDSRVIRGSFGDQWLCGVKMNGKDYNWGIRVGGSVHRAVKALTGKKLRKGLKVEVERREFENDNGEFIKFIAVAED